MAIDLSASFSWAIFGILAWICLRSWLLPKSQILKGPRRYPIVGSYFEVVKNFPFLHDWLLSFFSEDSKTIAVDWGTFYNILTVDPINVEYILKTNFANYPKGEVVYEKNYELMGDGIFNSDGLVWKRHRKVASYEFSSRKLHDFSAKVFIGKAVEMMKVLDMFATSKTSVDFHDIAMRMTLDSICEVGFGVEMGFLSPQLPEVRFATSFDRVAELIVRRSIGPVWKLTRALQMGSEKELTHHVKVIDSFTFKVIQNRRNEIDTYKKAGKVYDKEDLLSRFMTAASNNEEETYQDKELRDSILNFVLAGRDTTAATLSWFIFCVCKNEQVRDRIYSELEQAFGHAEKLDFAEFADLLTQESLGNLHYLRASISETIRLYPAVPRDGKLALHDDVLPDGTKIKKGDAVTYVPYSMGRMKFLWGDDAAEFKPERWIKNSVYQPESPFKYTAFQAGPRVCLGKESAYLQMMISAAMLMKFFRFELVKDHVVHYRLLMVLVMLNGIKVNVYRR